MKFTQFLSGLACAMATALPTSLYAQSERPNIVVIMGDDIGLYNLSTYHQGLVGFDTPNIDRIANEGGKMMTYYAQQSCTAGRSAFITGQLPLRTGLSKVGLPGADLGIQPEDPTLATLLKPLGYATGQFGKNHLGDKDEFLPWRTGSTNSSAISTTSTPRRNPRTRITPQTRPLPKNMAQGAY